MRVQSCLKQKKKKRFEKAVLGRGLLRRRFFAASESNGRGDQDYCDYGYDDGEHEVERYWFYGCCSCELYADLVSAEVRCVPHVVVVGVLDVTLVLSRLTIYVYRRCSSIGYCGLRNSYVAKAECAAGSCHCE